jgi:AraC-like DNA-binding protein
MEMQIGMETDRKIWLSGLLANKNFLKKVQFVVHGRRASELAYQVSFSRLELVLEGALQHRIASDDGGTYVLTQTPDMACYILPDAWNEPLWDAPVTTLSLLLGAQRLGFSVLHWDGYRFDILGKYAIDRRGPRTGTFIMQALAEIQDQNRNQHLASLLVQALISHAHDLLQHPLHAASRGATLFNTIRTYIDEHFDQPLTRGAVSSALRISPDHLSHVFQKEANTSFNDYLTRVRLEHAKELLRKYDMKIKEVAHRCGFNDSDYFCRLFRQKTQRSPSEYRLHYQSLP